MEAPELGAQGHPAACTRTAIWTSGGSCGLSMVSRLQETQLGVCVILGTLGNNMAEISKPHTGTRSIWVDSPGF